MPDPRPKSDVWAVGPSHNPTTHNPLYLRASLLLFHAMLSEEDRAILDFERASWRDSGPKDLSIEMDLGLQSWVYYERLREIVSSSAGSSYDPLTAKRVLRIIEETADAELAV